MVGLSVAVVIFGASAVPAGADSITGTKSQLQALQAQIQAGAGRIAQLTLAYEQANTQAAALSQQVAGDQAQVNQLETQVQAASATLRNDAIYSYVGGAMSTNSGAADAEASAVGQEYLTLASGDLEDATDQYRAQERQVAAAQAQLAAEMKASEAAASATGSARQAALSQAEQVQGQVTALESHLQSLEAQQAAAASAAAAAAAKAAADAEAATQGLPVNNGLVTAVQTVTTSGGNAGGDWLRLRECESGDNYQENTGNGFYGAYQFSAQTWTGMGYPGRPDLESPAMQDQAAQQLQARSGWGQWPACSAALGLS